MQLRNWCEPTCCSAGPDFIRFSQNIESEGILNWYCTSQLTNYSMNRHVIDRCEWNCASNLIILCLTICLSIWYKVSWLQSYFLMFLWDLKVWTRRRASTMEAGVDVYATVSHRIPPLMHSFSVGSPGSNTSILLSPRGPTLYSSEETVESVIGN